MLEKGENMSGYVDGFVLPVPKNKLMAYKKMASDAGKIWMKYGALKYYECVGDDLNAKQSTIKFKSAAKAKSNETVIFSFIIYKSRKHRDQVNKKVMKEMEQSYDEYKDMQIPFDMKRMTFGGFKVLVKY